MHRLSGIRDDRSAGSSFGSSGRREFPGASAERDVPPTYFFSIAALSMWSTSAGRVTSEIAKAHAES